MCTLFAQLPAGPNVDFSHGSFIYSTAETARLPEKRILWHGTLGAELGPECARKYGGPQDRFEGETENRGHKTERAALSSSPFAIRAELRREAGVRFGVSETNFALTTP
jgi:hypothetical protein